MMSTSGLEHWPLSGLATTAAILLTVYAVLFQLQRVKKTPTSRRSSRRPSRSSATCSAWSSRAGRYYKMLG